MLTLNSIIMTGWGMSAHEQHLMISSKVSHPTDASFQGADPPLRTPDSRTFRVRFDRRWSLTYRRSVFRSRRQADTQWDHQGVPAPLAICQSPLSYSAWYNTDLL